MFRWEWKLFNDHINGHLAFGLLGGKTQTSDSADNFTPENVGCQNVSSKNVRIIFPQIVHLSLIKYYDNLRDLVGSAVVIALALEARGRGFDSRLDWISVSCIHFPLLL